MANTAKVNTIVINIKPILLGSFKKRAFIYPKIAERKTSTEIIVKISIMIYANMFIKSCSLIMGIPKLSALVRLLGPILSPATK